MKTMSGREVEITQKIAALEYGGSTPGERAAAKLALERIKDRPAVRITATVTNIDTGQTYYELSFAHLAGHTETMLLLRDLFYRPSKVMGELANAGADISDDREEACAQIASALRSKSSRKYSVTEGTGWHEGGIVLPGRTIGRLREVLRHKSAAEVDQAFGRTAGSLERWREGLRAPCEGSDYLIIAISSKAASLLLEIVGQDEGLLLHLHGDGKRLFDAGKTKSSSGKTLAVRVAASMTGRCRVNDLLTFGISPRALEDECFGHNSLGIEFDEEGRAFGNKNTRINASQLAYVVASGRGDVRSLKATQDQKLKNRKWALNALSSGEWPLDDQTVRKARAEGEQVRLIGLPVPPGDKGGIFNRVSEDATKMEACDALAKKTEATIAENYGLAFPAFAEKIVANRENLKSRIEHLITSFVSAVGATRSPWERRFGRKFGLTYAAAVLLAELEIAPWNAQRARQAIKRMYTKARRAAANVDEAAEHLTRRLRQRLNESRYPLLKKGDETANRKLARRGFRRDLTGVGRVLLIPMTTVNSLVETPVLAKLVLRRLAMNKIIHRAPDGKLARQVLVKAIANKKRRYVCFDVLKLKVN